MGTEPNAVQTTNKHWKMHQLEFMFHAAVNARIERYAYLLKTIALNWKFSTRQDDNF